MNVWSHPERLKRTQTSFETRLAALLRMRIFLQQKQPHAEEVARKRDRLEACFPTPPGPLPHHRHPRESGDPGAAEKSAVHPLGSRFRGNDEKRKRSFSRASRAGVWIAAIILLLTAIGYPAAAQQPAPQQVEPSLMFTPDEVNAIRKALVPQPVEEASQGGGGTDATAAKGKAKSPNIYVSAILDLGEGQWTVWANGQRITQDRQLPQFRILSVKQNAVEIVLPVDPPTKFSLHPYQTWRVDHHDIVEGIFP
jgi:hypothetical protein